MQNDCTDSHPDHLLIASHQPAEHWSIRRGAFVVLAGYATLVVSMLLIGWTLTHPLHSTVGRWDESVNQWFAQHRSGAWNDVTKVATLFVDTLPAIAVAAVMTSFLAWRHHFREAMLIVIALSLEVLVFLSVTFVVARPRPNVVRLNQTPSTSSFPSGHTAAATVLAAGFAIVVMCCTDRRVLRAVFVVLAVAASTLVGFARVYRGMHHPTDVVAGALLGAACLGVAIAAIRATPVRTTAGKASTPARQPLARVTAASTNRA